MNLKLIKASNSIDNAINAKIPADVIKERDAGRGTKLNYISGKTVTDILNSVFGTLNWDFEINNSFIQESIPYFDTYAKVGEKTTNVAGKQGVWVDQAPVAWVQGTLTVRLVDDNEQVHEIKKQSFGSKSIVGKQSEQEHIFKSAQTDALKKAASLFGIGLQIARNEAEEEYRVLLNREVLWTEENMNECKPLVELLEFSREYNVSAYELNEYLSELSDGSYLDIYTVPEDTIAELLTALKERVDE